MPIRASTISRSASRISSSSCFAFLTFVATRLQNIVARSSRTLIRDLCTRQATSLRRLTGRWSRSSATSAASASPAKSVTLPAATLPIHTSVSQIAVFTSRRIFEAITSKVENAGSSSPDSTTFSSAMLIRSAGRFFAAASFRIDCSALRLVVEHPAPLADQRPVVLGGLLRLVHRQGAPRFLILTFDAPSGVVLAVFAVRSYSLKAEMTNPAQRLRP
ncbi:hypothetical protein [Streptomyces sp. NPDC059883]|uniref:hypothetical protein n=1 Tax=unclassified Streptomyces TaxID=2593676 RepID=UPI00365D9350